MYVKMDINKKDITVIIPMYNSKKTIYKVLVAIINQTFSEYINEIIVVNDGSNDGSQQVVESIVNNSSIKVTLINCENGGVSKARNVGLFHAKTKWVALCDSDDEWLEDKLENQINIINNNPGIDFLGGNHTPYTQKIFFRNINSLKRITVKDLCFKTLPQTSTAIFKRYIYERLGGYDETQKYAEDGNFFMKIAANYGYFYDPKQVVIYGDGKSGFGDSGLSANIFKMHEGLIKNFNEMKQLNYISKSTHILAICYENIKFLRRKWLVKQWKEK